MNIVFASSDDIALRTLEEVSLKYNVICLLTSNKESRSRKKNRNLLEEFAVDRGITVFKFEHLLKEERNILANLSPDMLLCFSYSKIFGPKFLSLFSKTMNIHPSSLPLLRGPSPLQSALLNGERESAISFQTISLKMDEGDIYKKVLFEIKDDDDIITLRDKVSQLAALNISDVIDNYLNKAVKQEGCATYTSLFSKESGKIDFQKHTSSQIIAMQKAFLIYPKTYCNYNDKVLYFIKVRAVDNDKFVQFMNFSSGSVCTYSNEYKSYIIKTVDGFIALEKLMLSQGKELFASEFKNGFPIFCENNVLA